MGKFLIANPPLGIYKNEDIIIGQAFYLIQLDSHARMRRNILKEDIYFPTYSFNVYGKRGDQIENPEEYANRYKSKKSLREKLDLCSKEFVSDDESNIVEGVRKDFLTLAKKGYVMFKDGKRGYLNTPKIKKNFSLEDYLRDISTDGRTKKTLERYWDKNMSKPHPITKPTKFSIKNPLEGKQNLGPLFTLSNMWDHKYNSQNILIAGSERNLTNYIFLRGLCQIVLNNSFGMDQIFVYPQLRFFEGEKNWDIESLTKNYYDSDILRYALLSVSLKKGGIAKIDKSSLKEGKKFVHSLGNLNKVLDYIELKENWDGPLIEDLLSFNASRVLSNLRKELKDLSNEVRISKINGEFHNKKQRFSKEYSKIVQIANVITPKIYKKIVKNNGKN